MFELYQKQRWVLKIGTKVGAEIGTRDEKNAKRRLGIFELFT
jgi:hypothetical protein